MKKTLLMITIVSLFVTTPCFAEQPTVGKRISAMVKHGFFAGLSGAGTFLAAYGAIGFSKVQSGQINISQVDIIENLGRPLGELSNRALTNPHATVACVGTAAVLGSLCVYNMYKVGSNFFGAIDDNL